jgi:Kef-type K+ transport system membrane component KefB
VAARRFEEHLPALSSERMLHAVEDFGKLFAPIYFFSAGTHVEVGDFGIPSLFIGLTLAVGVLALRIGMVMLVQARDVADWRARLKVATALSPTLVFSLVLIEILRTTFGASGMLLDALLVYTLVVTLVPGFVLGAGRLPTAAEAAEAAAATDGLPEVIR